MGDDDESHLHASHLNMDEAFCARMHAAIEAGLESAPIGVITTPGTRKPKYVSDLTARYHVAGYWDYYRTSWPGRGNDEESTR